MAPTTESAVVVNLLSWYLFSNKKVISHTNVNMAAVNGRTCKRKLSENECNTSDSNRDFDSDDSVIDRDYVVTSSTSDDESSSDLSVS